ncbi:MAG TPA: hypothetical protein VF519_15630 [Mycobacteriales bacterium]
MFRKKSRAREASGESLRTIEKLNPLYYERVQGRLRLWDAPDASIENAATSTANAIFNVAMNYFGRLGDDRAGRAFALQFEKRVAGDLTVADKMIDQLISYDADTQEFLTTLLQRLEDLAGRPPT